MSRTLRLADVDVLTGVATRRAFMEAAQRAITLASERRPLAIIAVDIDHQPIGLGDLCADGDLHRRALYGSVATLRRWPPRPSA